MILGQIIVEITYKILISLIIIIFFMRCPLVIIRVRTEAWILEKVLKFARQFSRPGKSLENEDKVWENDKKSWVFFSKLFILVKSYSIWPFTHVAHHEKSFLSAFLKVPVDHLVWKKKLLFWKKSWILDPKVCMNPDE